VGTWHYTLETPQGDKGSFTLQEKDGEYSGTLSNPRIREVTLEDVNINGNEISFRYPVSMGGNTVYVVVTGVVAGDRMNGSIQLGQRTLPFTAQRQR